MVTTVAQPAELLLLTLADVGELVSRSHNLRETLTNICQLIQVRIDADVCSVYTLDAIKAELTLRATVGLNQDSVEQVRMPMHEGLTGLAAERCEPVAVKDAARHERYRYFPESGEEQYSSFLGVPMIQAGNVVGVLVIQHIVEREYSREEIRVLVGVAAQIAILVINARLTEQLCQAARTSEAPSVRRSKQFHGASASPGIGHGNAVVFEAFDFENPSHTQRPAGMPSDEKALLASAMLKSRQEMDRTASHLADLLGDQFGALLHAQRLMLEDNSVQRDLHRRIDTGLSCEQAIVAVCLNYLQAFQKLDNQYFYERIYDIKDVFRRLLGSVTTTSMTRNENDIVMVAEEVSLLELLVCDPRRVRGIITAKGGTFSHVAILAKSLGIPMVANLPGLLSQVHDQDEIFVDGASGTVFVNPDDKQRALCLRLLAEQQATPEEALPIDCPLPVRLESAVNLLPEIALTIKNGGAAVGLYRSEMLELANRSFPTESEQRFMYSRMIKLLDGRPLTVRTLDLRPDKMFGIDDANRDAVWEWRLVHELPNVQEVIRTQLRSILSAAQEGPVRILFPMIVSDEQLACALQLLAEARAELAGEGLAPPAPVTVGIMIETPAAAMMVRRWAVKVDFIAIGSNDLLHSLFGIGREDGVLLAQRSVIAPAFLQTIHHIVRQAHAVGKRVTVCGEAAAHPQAAQALVALGVDVLCVPPHLLNKLRRTLAALTNRAGADSLARSIVVAQTADEVRALLSSSLADAT